MTGSSAVPAILQGGDGLLLGVRVSPSAPRTAVRGVYGERLKVSLAAPPEDNKANAELLRALVSWLGLQKDCVLLQSGHASRDKVVVIRGVGETELQERLAALLQRDRGGKGERHYGS